MFELIDKIRQKPEKTKKRIAFLASLTFTGIILFFWILAVYPDFKERNSIEKKARKLESGPSSSFASVFSGKVGEIKEQFSKLRGYASSLTPTEDYYVASPTKASSSTELMFNP